MSLKLHTMTIEIEYFDDKAEKIESLLWKLMQEAESFSYNTGFRVIRDPLLDNRPGSW